MACTDVGPLLVGELEFAGQVVAQQSGGALGADDDLIEPLGLAAGFRIFASWPLASAAALAKPASAFSSRAVAERETGQIERVEHRPPGFLLIGGQFQVVEDGLVVDEGPVGIGGGGVVGLERDGESQREEQRGQQDSAGA